MYRTSSEVRSAIAPGFSKTGALKGPGTATTVTVEVRVSRGPGSHYLWRTVCAGTEAPRARRRGRRNNGAAPGVRVSTTLQSPLLHHASMHIYRLMFTKKITLYRNTLEG
ncbi:hypothetical protein EVAR_28447_1 [Eumeta japonica]|uniref:Uncharacterized protein n=1 Tax=Eumeta variegata TaxID=151549 RepID=A0A4C1V9A6_EUMVA|nr:hypothetical protein EVAR_28447_1 [Eumeta japonica]